MDINPKFRHLNRFNNPELNHRQGAKPFIHNKPFPYQIYSSSNPSSGSSTPSLNNIREAVRIPITVIKKDGTKTSLNSIRSDNNLQKYNKRFDNSTQSPQKEPQTLPKPGSKLFRKGSILKHAKPGEVIPLPAPVCRKLSNDSIHSVRFEVHDVDDSRSISPLIGKDEDKNEDSNDSLAKQVKLSPSLKRKDKSKQKYLLNRRNSTKSLTSIDAEELAQITKELEKLQENGKDNPDEDSFSNISDDPTKFEKTIDNKSDQIDKANSGKHKITSPEINQLSKIENILAPEVSKFNDDILKEALRIVTVPANLQDLSDSELKNYQKLAIQSGEYLVRIMENLDGLDILDQNVKFSRKVTSSIGNFWMDKADKIESDIKNILNHRASADLL